MTIFVIILLLILLGFFWSRWTRAARSEYIRTYRLPKGIFESLKNKYPHLEPKDHQLAARALKQYFLAHLKSGRKYVSMPSQAVDEVWHDFILNTREYAQFCKRAFGRFMHHTPAVVMSSNRKSNEGLRRCWWYACEEESIDQRKPLRLPLLFAIDTKLNIPDGFRYLPDCSRFGDRFSDNFGGGKVHCGGDFSSTSFDGTSDGFGDGSAGSGTDGGCGGGCGGGD